MTQASGSSDERRDDLGGLEQHDRDGAAKAARWAAEDLARRLKVNRREIALQGITPMAWPDASLGCPEPDRMYAQVLTPGYVVLLSCGKDEYEYRIGGRRILVFSGPKGLLK